MKFFSLVLLSMCVLTSACSFRHAAYTAGGAATGAAVGYSYHHDDKEAAIGGLVGGVAGAALGGLEQNNQNKQFKKGYSEGYAQARVDAAKDHWEQTTGKGAASVKKQPRLKKFSIPKHQHDGVLYESQEVILEDYR